MRRGMSRCLVVFWLLLSLGCSRSKERVSAKWEVTPVGMQSVRLTDRFWAPRVNRHASSMLPHCMEQTDSITGRLRNFKNAAKRAGVHEGYYFDDSDVYKLLEGMAYSLSIHPDSALERRCDEWIDLFARAQWPDGYLSTYYTLTGSEDRWSDIYMHEMYCMGHMIEAAIAYYQATGKENLLAVAVRAADHLMDHFGPDKRDWVPGHEEIELALVRLADVTNNQKYLDFAYWLLEERGHGHTVGKNPFGLDYHQDMEPVRALRNAYGHSVRAMYLYCAMTDMVAYRGEDSYREALDSLWVDVVDRNMYVTGGIGSTDSIEGFTRDYDLPNATAYSELCASVGMIYWSSRMNQLYGDSKYVDVLERSLYNSGLSGINLDCNRFFQPNILESDGTHHRVPWYGCACCPTQAARFFPTIGNYVYGLSDSALYVNLYVSNTASIADGPGEIVLSQAGDYPWDGTIRLAFESDMNKELRMRIPKWASQYAFYRNSEAVHPRIEKGYAVLEGSWKSGDSVLLVLEMPVEVILPDPNVSATRGKYAIRRGPIVYCMEEIDNEGMYDRAIVSPDMSFEPVVSSDLFKESVVLLHGSDGENEIRLIPYYAWDNRTPSRMKVWLDGSQESVR